jgi:putative tryptophan/tyrosine transport system substrate-binding protein
VKRRTFIAGLGSAVAWPIVALAQQRAIPVVGYLPSSGSAIGAGFRQGLAELGYVDGQNVRIDIRASGYDGLSVVAQDWVRQQVSAIVTEGVPQTRAAKAATATIPIVFVIGADPVEFGLVASFNRPGGNITGVTQLASDLSGKRLDLLLKLLPAAATIAVLSNPKNPASEHDVGETQAAAARIGRAIEVVRASTDAEIDTAFASLVDRRAGALIINADPFMAGANLDRLVALATRHAIPTIYPFRTGPAAGGLVSYGADIADVRRQTGIYVGRILKGTRPADLPILRPTKFQLVINLKTAKALGLTIPETLLATADEVIQ